jgi:crossover junction endodeoxyribonuclease RuvC
VFVLGVDPGVTRCGYGLVGRAGSELVAVAAGVIATDPADGLPKRLGCLAEELDRLVGEYRPGAVAVERVLFQANARTAMAVGQASGLALVAAWRAGCSVHQYSANEVKLAVAGYGSATKTELARMVATRLGLAGELRPADATDALALALCHHLAAPWLERCGAGTEGDGP